MHIQPGSIKIMGSDEKKIQVHYSGKNADQRKDVKVNLKTRGDVGELNIRGGHAISSKSKLRFRKAAIFTCA
jgi:uncharacterized membrane protein